MKQKLKKTTETRALSTGRRKTMKYISIVMTIVVSAVISTAEQPEKGLIPGVDVFGGKLKISGFVDITANKAENTKLDSDIDPARVRASYKHEELVGSMEINFAEIGVEKGNYIREAWVGYDNGEQKLEIGRIFRAGGWTLPTRYDLETVRYPLADFMASYGWGVGLQLKLTNNLLLLMDVTGNPEVSFNSNANWETFGASGRLQYSFNASSFLAISGEVTKNYQRISTDWSVKLGDLKRWTVRSELSYEHQDDSHTSDRLGFYLFEAYRVKWFEIHGQVDFVQNLSKTWHEYQTSKDEEDNVTISRVLMESDGSHYLALLAGIRLIGLKDDAVSLTTNINYQPETEISELKARVQFKF